MSASVYPVHIDAELDRHLSRWLWLVKWAMAIPHYLVLVFLWTAFVLLSAVALVSIVVTGRYPRTIFDFNVGVLRWSWRVAYYTYGALATDRYPPFTLEEVPDYPAHLTVDYPEHLSRGLALVKWWLLAIPHYLVVAIFAGGGLYVAWDSTQGDPDRWTWGGGLIGLLALVAAVVLLFTGRYPQQIFDIVLGLNRWVLRVAAYAGLMTDDYPPFRLDLGGHDPHDLAAARMAVPSAPPAAVATAPAAGAVSAGEVPPQPAPAAERQGQSPAQAGAAPKATWGAGRIVTVVVGAIAFLVAGALLTGGAILGVGGTTLRNDQGFLMSPNQSFSTGTYAVATEPVTIEGAWSDTVPEALLGDVAVRARAAGGEELFVGVAPTADVEEYLAGAAYATVVRVEEVGGSTTPFYRESSGGAPALLPTETDIWAASATGAGEQQLSWEPTSGAWTVVVMNADGGPGVTADVAVGAELPALGWVVLGMLVAGGLLLVVSVALVLAALYAGRGRRGTPSSVERKP